MDNDQILHLAKIGRLDLIPPSEFTQETIETHDTDNQGLCPLHYAAYSNQLYLAPKKLLTHRNLSIRAYDGSNVYFCATKSNCFKSIPKELITKKVLLEKGPKEQTPLGNLIFNRETKLIPKELMTNDLLISPLRNESMSANTTVAHEIVKTGRLKDIPQKLITKDLVLSRDSKSNTLAHYAAMTGCLIDIPEEVLSLEILEAKNNKGETSLHRATTAGAEVIGNFPEEFLTDSLISETDNQDQTALHLLVSAYAIDSVPDQFLKEKHLIALSQQGVTPLMHLIDDYNEHSQRGRMEKVMRSLSTKTLKEYQKLYSQPNPLDKTILKLFKDELQKRKILKEIKSWSKQNCIEI